MRGALNVGASVDSLSQVVDDIGQLTATGYRSALEILARLRER
jgi:hypothetical protein